MRIGILKEIKNNENRVAITPAGVSSLKSNNFEVLIETGAGLGSGFNDEDYISQGAIIIDDPAEVWASDIVLKVKEPLESEYKYFREGLVLFTYLHLAAAPDLAKALSENKVTAIGYETIEDNLGSLPLLTPMSEVAGKMSVQIGAEYLTRHRGGSGVLLGGVPGVRKGKVTIIGGGVVGTNAARVALGMGANVTILNRSIKRLSELDDLFNHQVTTLASNSLNIAKSVSEADLVIGAVLVPGAKAPKLVTEQMVKLMKPGSVIVDVAIDQGGIFETIDRVTSHSDPVFEKHGVLHYAVANMPGAVARTSTIALTNATLPYVIKLAKYGIEKAFSMDRGFKLGLNTYKGFVTYKAVADDLQLEYKSYEELL